MKHFFDLDEAEIKSLFLELGEKDFRRKQFCDWVFDKLENDINNMTNISLSTRKKLSEKIKLKLPKIRKEQKSVDGTTKFLLQLTDRSLIEMVIIPTENKNTLCISSQVGCRQGCKFCATSKLGFKRGLEVNEIISQVYLASKQIYPKKITNIVFMGMGEPLDNFDNVVKSVKLMQQDFNLKISPRRITISTCGLANKIMKLADTGIKVKLALSLNAAIDEKRKKIMPVTNKFNLNTIKSALKYFRNKTAFRVTLEYIMIKNFNMFPEDIKAIKKFAGDLSCKLNLIPFNSVDNTEFETPTTTDIDNFINGLSSLSAAITVRNSRGQDIAAACGQLAAK